MTFYLYFSLVNQKKIAAPVFQAGVQAGCHDLVNLNVRALAWRHDFRDAVQDLQGPPLRGPETQPSGYGVDVGVHSGLPFK
jgi:hypothetical protein